MSATSFCRDLAINHRGEPKATPMSLQSQRPWPYQKFADLAEPSETDIDRTAKLDAWISENAEQDDRDEQKKKEQIIVDITNTVRKWVSPRTAPRPRGIKSKTFSKLTPAHVPRPGHQYSH